MAEIERVTGIIIDSAEDKLREMPKQPVKSVIVAMISQLQHILFPGVFEHPTKFPAEGAAELIVSYPGIYAGMVHRIAHELYLLSVPLIPRIMSEYAHNVTGIDIHPGAVIGRYFFMDHGTGIVIGETTIIGNNVKLYQGVTFGALSTKGGQSIKGVKRHPTIHDNVTVYSGASILGGDTIIGEGVVIGGNAFVVRSIPEKTRVSVKNPELQYKNNNISTRIELDQKEFWYYEI